MSFSKVISIIISLVIILVSKGIFNNRKHSFNRIESDERNDRDERNELDEMDKDMPSIKASPVRATGSFAQAYELWKQGSPREALMILNKSNRHDLNSCILLGEVYYDLRDFDSAISAYKNSLRAGSTSFAYTRLGEIYEGMELYADGIKAYKAALKCPGAQKGYLYHKLGNLYMYAGNELKSEKYTEKAETYHSDGLGTRIQAYDFTKKSTAKAKKNTSLMLIIIIIILLVFLGSFIPLIMNVQSTTSYIEEVAIEDVTIEDVTISEEDVIVIDPIEEAILQNRFGNTNSNINYGGHITEYNGHTYLFEDNGIQKINEDNGTMELVVETSSVAYINVQGDKIFYIQYNGDSSTVNYQSMNSHSSVAYSSDNPWNLLVDEQYMYFIEGFENQILRIESHIGNGSFDLALNDAYMINQTEDALFILQDGMIYKVLKDEIVNRIDRISAEHIFLEGDITFMTVEDNYMFFTKENDMNLYRKSIDGGMATSILDNFDINTMTLNAYKGELFIGVEGDEVFTDIYDFDGFYTGSVEGTIGNQLSNDYLYWYVE